jgi:hypothetical protein
MTTSEADGYAFAVEQAIETAWDRASSKFYEGMACGLCLWAKAVTEQQWTIDRYRIKEAREANNDKRHRHEHLSTHQ